MTMGFPLPSNGKESSRCYDNTVMPQMRGCSSVVQGDKKSIIFPFLETNVQGQIKLFHSGPSLLELIMFFHKPNL